MSNSFFLFFFFACLSTIYSAFSIDESSIIEESFSFLSSSSYEFYIQLDVPSPLSNLNNSDIINTLKVVNGAIPFNSSYYYLSDVNGDGRVTVSDAYYIGARKQGRFTTWLGTFTSRLFTPTEYSTIKSNVSNLKPTYPGVSSITVSSPTSGGSSNYYIIAPGYSTNTTF